MKNRLYGDNLPIMRERIATETVDLVYLDHPFKSDLNYNVRASWVTFGKTTRVLPISAHEPTVQVGAGGHPNITGKFAHHGGKDRAARRAREAQE